MSENPKILPPINFIELQRIERISKMLSKDVPELPPPSLRELRLSQLLSHSNCYEAVYGEKRNEVKHHPLTEAMSLAFEDGYQFAKAEGKADGTDITECKDAVMAILKNVRSGKENDMDSVMSSIYYEFAVVLNRFIYYAINFPPFVGLDSACEASDKDGLTLHFSRAFSAWLNGESESTIATCAKKDLVSMGYSEDELDEE